LPRRQARRTKRKIVQADPSSDSEDEEDEESDDEINSQEASSLEDKPMVEESSQEEEEEEEEDEESEEKEIIPVVSARMTRNRTPVAPESEVVRTQRQVPKQTIEVKKAFEKKTIVKEVIT